MGYANKGDTMIGREILFTESAHWDFNKNTIEMCVSLSAVDIITSKKEEILIRITIALFVG